MVSTSTTIGSIGLLANHQPVLAMLDPAELRLYKTETEIVKFAQAEGYMQVAGGRVMLLVEEAHPPGQLDVSALRERLGQAERELESAGDDTEKQRVAKRDKRRWETFLSIAESG
jgi:F-type H+-transporting ATPase subunit epsilon